METLHVVAQAGNIAAYRTEHNTDPFQKPDETVVNDLETPPPPPQKKPPPPPPWIWASIPGISLPVMPRSCPFLLESHGGSLRVRIGSASPRDQRFLKLPPRLVRTGHKALIGCFRLRSPTTLH